MKRKPPRLDKPYPRHRPASPDENALWREAMGEETAPASAGGKAILIASRSTGEAAERDEAAGGERVKRGTAGKSKSREKIAPASLDKTTLSRLRRGQVKIDATLDLHGYTKQEAHGALLAFIARAGRRGWRLALIITGKGKGGPGTLRTELPRWLNESPLREHIVAYDVAGPSHGGQGAWYVRLRKEVRDRGSEIRK